MFYFPSTHRSHLTFNLANLEMTIKTLKKGYFQNINWVQSRSDKSTLNLTQMTILYKTWAAAMTWSSIWDEFLQMKIVALNVETCSTLASAGIWWQDTGGIFKDQQEHRLKFS